MVRRRVTGRRAGAASEPVERVRPFPHPSGALPPELPAELVPQHIAIVMDGNGRWANARGLPRTKGHEMGEGVLLDVVAGAIEVGVRHLSVYAFSTENWRRSPEEVRFLMGFNRDVIRRRRDQLHSWGVRVRWAGRRPRLWRSVITELETAEELTRANDVITLTMCVNYGGRAEIADAARAVAREAAAGRLDPEKVDERLLAKYLDEPDLPEVDLFLRSGGEQRTSNFMLWQSAYAELVFVPELWPDVDRRVLWRAIDEYAKRDRRYGGAIDAAAIAVLSRRTCVASFVAIHWLAWGCWTQALRGCEDARQWLSRHRLPANDATVDLVTRRLRARRRGWWIDRARVHGRGCWWAGGRWRTTRSGPGGPHGCLAARGRHGLRRRGRRAALGDVEPLGPPGARGAAGAGRVAAASDLGRPRRPRFVRRAAVLVGVVLLVAVEAYRQTGAAEAAAMVFIALARAAHVVPAARDRSAAAAPGRRRGSRSRSTTGCVAKRRTTPRPTG